MLSETRKLDQQIAEKVFRKKVYYHAGSHDICFCDIDGDDDRTMCQGPVPKYSEEIGAAWEVVENLRNRPGILEVILNGLKGEWCCQVFIGTDMTKLFDGRVSANAATAPLAVCRCALRFLEAQ